MPSNFLKRLFGGTSKELASLSILPHDSPTTHRIPLASKPPLSTLRKADVIPANFYQYEFYIDLKINGVVHIGYPKVCIRTPDAIRWGGSIEWSCPSVGQARLPWVDDPELGLAKRKLEHIEDPLGAEGRIGDMRLRFEKILDVGDNVVVYALFSPEKNIRLAYGFDRTAFEPTHLSASALRRLAKKLEDTPSN